MAMEETIDQRMYQYGPILSELDLHQRRGTCAFTSIRVRADLESMSRGWLRRKGMLAVRTSIT